MWERCGLGLPSIVTCLADNQRPGIEKVAEEGGIVFIGDSYQTTPKSVCEVARTVSRLPHLLSCMRTYGMGLIDGRGCERVVRQLLPVTRSIRIARDEDCEDVYRWRNAEETRRFSSDNAPINYASHRRWYQNVLVDPNRIILIGEVSNNAVGVLRYDRNGTRATVSVYLVPGNQGKGYGAMLISQGTVWLKQNWPDVEIVDAEIRTENGASLASFSSAGYEPTYCSYTLATKD